MQVLTQRNTETKQYLTSSYAKNINTVNFKDPAFTHIVNYS